jgi:hypothetical protein
MLLVSLVTASHSCHKKLGKTTHIAVREARIRLDSPISYSDLHPRRNTCIPDLENPSSEKKLRFGKDKNCDLRPSSVPCRLGWTNLGLPKNIEFHAGL